MSSTERQPPRNAFSEIIDFVVEGRIRVDALEQVLKETNPLVYELYLGQIEDSKEQKGGEMKRALISKLMKS